MCGRTRYLKTLPLDAVDIYNVGLECLQRKVTVFNALNPQLWMSSVCVA